MRSQLSIQQLTEFLDGHVHDEADIADAEARDVGDLLVGAVMHEFEANDLLLIRPEVFHKVPDALVELAGNGVFTGVRVVIDGQLDGVLVAEVEPLVLAQHVEGAVSADGEKPGFEIVTDLLRISEVELEHGILHHFTGTLDVAVEDTSGVGDEAALVLIQRPPDKEGGFIWMGLERHGDTVSLPETRPAQVY